MNVLIVAIEDNRWGPARLPKVLQAAGFRVAALCLPDNPLAHTRFLERRFILPDTRSADKIANALWRTMKGWQPQLVIPADEQSVALLQTLLADIPHSPLRRWPHAMLDVLQFSLGEPSRRDAMLFKNRTQELAREIGVRVPAGDRVRSLAEACSTARALGYPVLVKQSFSWGGAGVRMCKDEAQLQAAYREMAPGPERKSLQWIRRQLGRDWYPTPRHLWIQAVIDGAPAMYTLVACRGQLRAGFAGFPRSTSTATGPSTVVEFRAHAAMADASARMVEALGATGFLSFDFMIERSTGEAFLLECNPRPNQVSHLGARVGVDLCAALRSGLVMGPGVAAPPPIEAQRSETVALFPQQWLNDPASVPLHGCFHDVPWEDGTLMARMAAEGRSYPASARPAQGSSAGARHRPELVARSGGGFASNSMGLAKRSLPSGQ